MKNIYSKLALVLIAFAITLACTSDDYTDASTQTAANSTLSVTLDFPSSQTFVETEATYAFTVTLSEPQIVDVVVYLSASGTATEGDDYAFPHSLRMPAGSTSISDVITIHRNMDPEDTETVVINIGTGFEANVSSINGATASFTLQDYTFCTWILETSDTYGDGWNGGYIEVTTEGVTTEYHEDDDVPTTFEIVIGDSFDYSFTYVSGGGTGGAPGWESENYYKLTAPDGTVWEDGTMDYTGIPTPGIIVSGTNECP